ncbi:MAG: diguanylate cyclase [Deltaproteobacteria bacterium]
MNDAPEPSQGSPWRGFLLKLYVVVVVVTFAAVVGLVWSQEHAIGHELEARGRALFESIVLVRKWNSDHGGLFVEKKDGVVSNPFLEDPDRRGDDGTVYTLKNPALMTREISELAEKDANFRFHITSEHPVNPANKPDPFELAALQAFERGVEEETAREEIGGEPVFRYMAPLRVEESCLRCHAEHGYQVGDIRGGISVTFGISGEKDDIREMRWVAVAFFVGAAAFLLLFISRLVAALQRRVVAAEAQIREMALTDSLTELPNRRATTMRLELETARAARYGRPVAVVLLDVDHFKDLNDTGGHEAGDAILKALAQAGTGALREADLLGRWGGEEFLAVLPETDAAGARILAERLRTTIEALRVSQRDERFHVTVSAGVAAWAPSAPGCIPLDIDVLLREADAALYRAKGGAGTESRVARLRLDGRRARGHVSGS